MVALKYRQTNSAWKKGVNEYAFEIVHENALDEIESVGVHEWSYGGCSLVYDEDIAHRLCTPTELKRCKFGENPPNLHETWLDVQARAIKQAVSRIKSCCKCDLQQLLPLFDGTCTYHHTAFASGYFPVDCYRVENYNGRYGRGFRVHVNAPNTTRFHKVEYYIKES